MPPVLVLCTAAMVGVFCPANFHAACLAVIASSVNQGTVWHCTVHIPDLAFFWGPAPLVLTCTFVKSTASRHLMH